MTAAIAAARSAWRGSMPSLPERRRRLAALRAVIVERVEEIARVIGEQTGKPKAETLLNDVIPALALIKYYEENAAKILRPERRPATLLFHRSRFEVEYHARGVVLVLAPFNLPFQLAVAPVISAFAAANAAVCKVSEHTPRVAALLRGLFEEADFAGGLVSFLAGGAELGEALVREKPDLVFLTGGTATGKRVMGLAAADLIPVILELGGKDPMIVFADAPFERAVAGAVYGAFANAGQICVAAQRIYVERPIFDRFVDEAARETNRLRVARGADSDIGPLVSAAQAERFAALVAEALDHGARLHTPFKISGRVASPAVLTGVPRQLPIMREEIFGPLMTVTPFDTEQEALELANDTPYGLNASVWTSDLQRGRRVAARIEAGSVAVNDVLKNIGNPHVPFGGIKGSGYGFYHGPEGLRAFCRPLSVMLNPGSARREPNWFPYTDEKARQLRAMIGLLYGGGSALARLWRLRKLRTGLGAAIGGERV
jgi:acyl-CoA reductase-like NAD-dependent aldehyde dehydrogenase